MFILSGNRLQQILLIVELAMGFVVKSPPLMNSAKIVGDINDYNLNQRRFHYYTIDNKDLSFLSI